MAVAADSCSVYLSELVRRRIGRGGDARLAPGPERDGDQRPDREGQPQNVRKAQGQE